MSDEITYCRNLPENCIGGQSNHTCYEGHLGALCEACDIDMRENTESYANSD